MKYNIPPKEAEILPNLLNLTTSDAVALSEFEGFVKAEIFLSESLNKDVTFNVAYIIQIHKLALGHLYSFAGEYRTVNLTKDGFTFPAAKFLHISMDSFEHDILSKLPIEYSSKADLILDIAKVHAELLFIHPFREGNGRTARVLANLMMRKQGLPGLHFERIKEREFEQYVLGVQKAAGKDYSYMINLITTIYPD